MIAKCLFFSVLVYFTLCSSLICFSQKKNTNVKMPLTVNVKNLVANKGSLVIGVYSPDNKFPDPKDQLKVYRFKVKHSEMNVILRNLKFGTYAAAIYQDINMNGKIDKNFIGIPNEPYAFSNNFKPTIKAPSFNDCKFDYMGIKTINIDMIR